MNIRLHSVNQLAKRLIDVKLKDQKGQLTDIDDEKTYRVATNAFVGTGGDGYSVFTEASHGEDLGYVDYEIFKEQIEKADGQISPVIDHRVKEVFLPRAKGKGAYDIQDDKKFQTYVQRYKQSIALSRQSKQSEKRSIVSIKSANSRAEEKRARSKRHHLS
nr:5'-nucleotidase C-terminal domain-containing protein [Bacillus pumilus]